jgi:hypothetical protein
MERKLAAALLIFLSGTAAAADDIETVYAKLHAAAAAKNVDEMMKYATEARRNELAVMPDREPVVALMAATMPRTYRVTGKAFSPDGNAAQLRASGLSGMVGMGEQLVYGVMDFAREKGEWKVERWSWSSERPVAPPGFVRSQEPREAPGAKAAEPARVAEPVLSIEKSQPQCVIRPVMTDAELRACGARLPE